VPEQQEPPAEPVAAWVRQAGHDLRTPLAVISGVAEMLQSSWDRLAEADRGRLLTSIQTQAARAVALLDEGVALAKESSESKPTDGPDEASQR